MPLSALFNQWNNPQWLFDFFVKNIDDLKTYFKITDIDNLEELVKMEKVRRFLLENGIVDNVGLVEYINNEQ